MSPKQKEQELLVNLSRFKSAIVAFSGGVDSSYLAFVANRVLGPSARIVTALSPSVSKMQEQLARDFAARYALNHTVIDTHEFNDPDYTANPANRCYFCKSELFDELAKLRDEWGADVVLDGSNADDVADYRPGKKAAQERRVLSPLVDAGMSKSDIRQLSREWGLSSWNLPAMPCLSSRLPYGVEVTPEKLRQVEEAENVLRSLGFEEFRVRHHEGIARLEISRSEMAGILEIRVFEEINRRLKALGYQYVTLDLEGFRSGSLNELLQIERAPGE